MDNPSPWYYRFVYFFVAQQILLKRLLVVILILLNIILWWGAWSKFVSYISYTSYYEQMLNQLTMPVVNWAAYHEATKPQELQLLGSYQLKSDKNKYDLVAKVSNVNQNWLARQVDYFFIVDGLPLAKQTTFVAPGQQKFLVHFGYVSESYPTNVEIKIEAVSWQRWQDKELLRSLDNLIISGESYLQERGVSEVSFNVTNNNNFGWWQIGWQIALYQSNAPVAVNYVTIDKLLAGQTRAIVASWLEGISTPSRIEIIPDIDLNDANNYILGGDSTYPGWVRGTSTSIKSP